MAAESEFAEIVRLLGCLRGNQRSDLSGFALALEVGDRHRFTAATIGSFVGLTPGEHSSGKTMSDRWHLAPQLHSPRRRGQPAPAPAMGVVHRAPHKEHDGVTAHDLLHLPPNGLVAARRATRDPAMSNWLRPGDARP